MLVTSLYPLKCDEFVSTKVGKALTAIEAELPRWIPVSERLPEVGYYYVIRDCGDGRRWIDNAVFMGEYWEGDELFRGRVTHWLPFPKWPEKEGEK